jgi:hypothetical protein
MVVARTINPAPMTPRLPSSNYEQLRSLEWMVGNWVAKSSGQSLELSCEWTAKRNFLLRKYILKNADGPIKTGMQIIGWDPVEGEIHSWVIDSDAGFGSGLAQATTAPTPLRAPGPQVRR